MQQRIAQTLRYLAGLINQQTARTNAAEASATIRERRHDQERVDRYLHARLLTLSADETEAGESGQLEGQHIL